MRRTLLAASVAIATVVALGVDFSSITAARSQRSAEPPPRNLEEFDKMFRDLNNWGRWGKDDERGAANLITADKIKQVAALVKTGITVSLAHNPIVELTEDNETGSFEHIMRGPSFGSDTYRFTYHDVSSSHLDGLCHYAYKGMLYNGFPASTRSAKGCGKNGIQNMKNGIVTRGVLIDIPRLKGVPWLEPGTAVYTQDIEAWEKKAGVRVSAGDALILNTGRWARRAKLGPWKRRGNSAGFHTSVAPWIKARDVAMTGSDGAFDVEPQRFMDRPGTAYDEGLHHPLHTFDIVGLGITQLDSQDLTALSETAAKLNRWEFMLVVAPIPVTGGTGSPVNALAIF